MVSVFKSNEVFSFKSDVVLDTTTGSDELLVIVMTFREVCSPAVMKYNKFLSGVCRFYKEAMKRTPDHLDPERDVLHIVYSEKFGEASVFVEFTHFEHAQIKTLSNLFTIFSKLGKNMNAHAYLRYFNDYSEHAILTLSVYRIENPESPIWDFINEIKEVTNL